jgi:FkbM family methyltransferase
MVFGQRSQISKRLYNTPPEYAKAKIVLALITSVLLACVGLKNFLDNSHLLTRIVRDNSLLSNVDSSFTATTLQTKSVSKILLSNKQPEQGIDNANANAPTETTDSNLNDGTTATSSQQSHLPSLTIPILPLTSSVKHSHRPISHLTMDMQNLTPVGLPVVSLNYLNGSVDDLNAEYLYPISNYKNWYEKAVTHMWISILHTRKGKESTHIVVDGGMNTGFYTTLTAVMGFEVHSFELQLDCFDVTKLLLRGNNVGANLYNIGISDEIRVIEADEGCNPGYAIQNLNMTARDTFSWERRIHQVMLLPLDVVLDQKRANRQIALIKLDLEGHETIALRGLQRHLHAVQNLIMEVSPLYSSRNGVTLPDMFEQFHRLEDAGFQPYLLWLPQIEQAQWFNATFLLENCGVKNTHEHPILGANFTIGTDFSTMLWQIESYEKLFGTTCKEGCNVLFSRRREIVLANLSSASAS